MPIKIRFKKYSGLIVYLVLSVYTILKLFKELKTTLLESSNKVISYATDTK